MMLDTGLIGKTALITGANNAMGIGAAAARMLAAEGAHIFLTYKRGAFRDAAQKAEPGSALYSQLSAASGESIADEIRQHGGTAEALEVDLSDPHVIAPLFDHVEARFGAVDILINNAAHSTADTFLPSADALVNTHSVQWLGGNVPTLTQESHDAHFAVNTRAPALMMIEFARRFVARGASWGRIINLTTDGSPAFPSEIAYGASKHALESYTRAAALELGQFGITVNAVSPGATQTGWITAEMEADIVRATPLRRVGSAEDVAEVIRFLASNQARWMTGQIIHANGGQRV